MTREPVYEGSKLIGHNVTYPAIYTTFRDERGYVSVIRTQSLQTVFEPVVQQRGMFDEDD